MHIQSQGMHLGECQVGYEPASQWTHSCHGSKSPNRLQSELEVAREPQTIGHQQKELNLLQFASQDLNLGPSMQSLKHVGDCYRKAACSLTQSLEHLQQEASLNDAGGTEEEATQSLPYSKAQLQPAKFRA